MLIVSVCPNLAMAALVQFPFLEALARLVDTQRATSLA